jgi:putative salt-induced outer membrane protein YdiY
MKKIKLLGLLIQAAILLIPAGSPVLADEVILSNGDRLTGKVVELSNGSLTLATSYSEPINIQFGSVRQMSSTEPVEIHLTNGEVLKGKITTDNSGKILVEGRTGRDNVSIGMNNIAALNPPPKEPVSWKGNITLGGNLQSGNSETMNISTGLSAVRRSENDRFSLSFLYNRTEDDGNKTAENTYGQLKYDYFFSQKWYLYLNIDMLSDEFADINFRTTIGPGVGYQIWEEDDKALSLEAGGAYTSEDRDQGEDNDWVSARAGVNYMQKLFGRILFTDQFVIYPDLEDTGEYLLRNEASLVTDIGTKLAFKLSNIWERDSSPDPGLDEDDLTWILGLQYSF